VNKMSETIKEIEKIINWSGKEFTLLFRNYHFEYSEEEVNSDGHFDVRVDTPTGDLIKVSLNLHLTEGDEEEEIDRFIKDLSPICICGREMTRENTMNINREEGESRGSWGNWHCTATSGVHYGDRNCLYYILSQEAANDDSLRYQSIREGWLLHCDKLKITVWKSICGEEEKEVIFEDCYKCNHKYVKEVKAQFKR